MKLWKISQDRNNNWDTYDSAVVAAETEYKARFIHPRGMSVPVKDFPNDWAWPEDVTAEYLGEAEEGAPAGVIVASFNAG